MFELCVAYARFKRPDAVKEKSDKNGNNFLLPVGHESSGFSTADP